MPGLVSATHLLRAKGQIPLYPPLAKGGGHSGGPFAFCPGLCNNFPMLGAFLGLGYAAVFGLNNVFVRRGVLRVSANYVATLTVFSGPIFFLILTAITGDLYKISAFTWQATLFFAISGVIHFALGRSFGYRATFILGATRSGILTGLNGLVTVILAVTILKETMTPLMIVGMCLSLSGPTILAWREDKVMRTMQRAGNPGKGVVDRRTYYKGFFFGLCSALFWGSSAIFIKLGIDNGGTPLAGSFIAYTAASLVVAFSLFSKANRKEIFTGDRQALQLAGMSGLTTNVAQMLRYMAMGYGSVIVVSLVSRTMPIWTLSLSFIFNRKIETFNRWVILSTALLIIGTILVIF